LDKRSQNAINNGRRFMVECWGWLTGIQCLTIVQSKSGKGSGRRQ
jgi:hypothetical protein